MAHYHLALSKAGGGVDGGVEEPYAMPACPPAPPQMMKVTAANVGVVGGVGRGTVGDGECGDPKEEKSRIRNKQAKNATQQRIN